MKFLIVLGKPADLYNESNTDWLPNMSLGYILRLPDGERHIRLENRKGGT